MSSGTNFVGINNYWFSKRWIIDYFTWFSKEMRNMILILYNIVSSKTRSRVLILGDNEFLLFAMSMGQNSEGNHLLIFHLRKERIEGVGGRKSWVINICTKVLGYSSCSTFRVCTESWILEKVLKFAKQVENRGKVWKNGKSLEFFFFKATTSAYKGIFFP